MAALTVTQLITLGLQELGVAAAGEPVQPEDLSYGLTKFNLIIDNFKAERLMIAKVQRKTFAVTANTASFTIGPGGDWDIDSKPMAIERAGFLNTYVSPATPLETYIKVYTDEEWANITLKTLTGTIIYGLWYETDFSGSPTPGLGRIFPFPIITNSGTIALYVPIPIEEVDDDENGLATTIYVPPGYRAAFVKSIAIEVADKYGIAPSQMLVTSWTNAMRRVRRSNAKAAKLPIPFGITRRRSYNILSNQNQ